MLQATSSDAGPSDLPPSYTYTANTSNPTHKTRLLRILTNPSSNSKAQLVNISYIACLKEKPYSLPEVIMSAGPSRDALKTPVSSQPLDTILERCPDEFVVFPNKHRLRTAVRVGAIIQIESKGLNLTKISFFKCRDDESSGKTEVYVGVEEVARALDGVYVSEQIEKDKGFIRSLQDGGPIYRPYP